jgi:hypothetical protein
VRRRALIAALVLGVASRGAAAQTRAIIITGLGGEPQYSELFMSLGSRMATAMHDKFMMPDSNIVWLGEDSTSTQRWYAGQSTAQNITAAIERVASRAKAGEQIVIALIGHGSGQGDDTKFSIPGPDLTARDFAALLARFTAQHVAFLDLTSASGDVVAVLSGKDRIIVTSTKSAYERNESQFARFFVEALDKPGAADVDKDGRVSLLEAYRYAVTETRRSYTNDERLITEHSQLDDDGDGKGTDLPDGHSAGDGLASRRFFFDAGVAETRLAAGDPELARLYADRFAIEDQIDALRQKKTSMVEDNYYSELEGLLLDLARKQRDIRRKEGR